MTEIDLDGLEQDLARIDVWHSELCVNSNNKEYLDSQQAHNASEPYETFPLSQDREMLSKLAEVLSN